MKKLFDIFFAEVIVNLLASLIHNRSFSTSIDEVDWRLNVEQNVPQTLNCRCHFFDLTSKRIDLKCL